MNQPQEQALDPNIVLADIRQSIDHIDTSFMFIIAERTRLITKAIVLKLQQQLPIDYSEQRKQDLERTITLAIEHHVDENFIRNLFERIYQQANVMSENNLEINQQIVLQQLSDSNIIIQDIQASLYNLDTALCSLLGERYHLVNKVAKIKKKIKQPPLAANRWQAILTNKIAMATALNIDTDFIRDILELMHKESLRIETNIINQTPDE